LSIVPI